MKIYSVAIENFRGIHSAKLVLPDHAVLIGDNNTGKSSVLEAIDLALGPDRLSRRPPVDEHDFYQGKYLAAAKAQAAEGDVRSSFHFGPFDHRHSLNNGIRGGYRSGPCR